MAHNIIHSAMIKALFCLLEHLLKVVVGEASSFLSITFRYTDLSVLHFMGTLCIKFTNVHDSLVPPEKEPSPQIVAEVITSGLDDAP